MCGIAGFVGQGNREILEKMTRTLKHRGPDEEGFFVDDGVYLGNRRLSVIDLATGKQPILNEDKSVCVVLNGEIFNFKDLRKTLERNGHRFYTQSDTEVIVHLYEDRGEDFLKELNGQFALALWDKNKEKLLLARDRLGELPLYYSFFEGNFLFASELKAILAHPQTKRGLDFFALAKYLNYEYIPSPQTIFKNINKLGPGERLIYQKGKGINKERYWDIKFSPASKLQEPELLEEMDRQLDRSVKMRLVSDVPLGVWSSGGIDSTTVAYYAQKNSLKPIKTFFIGFTESSFDESKYARMAVKFLKTDHYEKVITPKDCLDLIPQITDFLDEPLADGGIIPTYLLSKFTREKVKVALTGNGGDELFMGYPTHQAYQLAKIYEKLPRFLREKIIPSLVNNLPTSFSDVSLDFRLKRFISGFGYKPEVRDQIWLGSFQSKDFKNLLSGEVYREIRDKNIFENIENYLAGLGGESTENRLIYLYLKNYMQEDCVAMYDRSSMAVGLELRSPFLDYRFVELVNSIPAKLKLRGFTTKYILKKLMENKIPKEIAWRRKKGFGAPIAIWIRNELKDFTLGLFDKNKINREGIFNYPYINRLLEEHFSGRKDNRKLLWTLMVFEMWMERWGKL